MSSRPLDAVADGTVSCPPGVVRVHGTVTSGLKAATGRTVSLELTVGQASGLLADLAARPQWRPVFETIAAELAAVGAELAAAVTPAQRVRLADPLYVGQRLRQALGRGTGGELSRGELSSGHDGAHAASGAGPRCLPRLGVAGLTRGLCVHVPQAQNALQVRPARGVTRAVHRVPVDSQEGLPLRRGQLGQDALGIGRGPGGAGQRAARSYRPC